ncbi:hypothetical protein ACFV0H_35240 [Streptomyces erythrochromogenes]|uniref:hypothetical protein n=1 Tax=Streptomyces erythrochromogenes TaxID=285574 RepID=UPI003679AD9F
MGWVEFEREKSDEAGLCRWCNGLMKRESRWYRRYCRTSHRLRMYWALTVARVLDNL